MATLQRPTTAINTVSASGCAGRQSRNYNAMEKFPNAYEYSLQYLPAGSRAPSLII